jgi:hypothetical protein
MQERNAGAAGGALAGYGLLPTRHFNTRPKA